MLFMMAQRRIFKRLISLLVCVGLLSMLPACGGPDERKAQYLASGKALFEEGNLVKAALEFKNALQIDSRDVEASFMLARVAEKKQEWRKAFGAYSRVLELDPRHLPALVRRGHLYRMNGATFDALEAADSALEIDSKNVDALVLRGATQNQIGMTEAGIQDLREALAIAPDAADARLLLVHLLAKQGEMDAAAALMEEAIRRQPADVGLHYRLARLYDQAGHVDRAVDQLRQAIEIRPDELNSWSLLASYYQYKEKLEQAEQVLRDAIQANPDSLEARLMLVELLAKLRGLAVAETELLALMEEYPEQSDRLRFGLADLYKAMRKPEQVKEIYQEIIARDTLGPDGLQARVRLARMLFAEGQRDQAAELVGVVLKQTPADTDALLMRARIALVRKASDQVIADIHTIWGGALKNREEFLLLDRTPDNVEALRLLAKANVQKQQHELAKEALETAVAFNPLDVSANLELAQLLAGTKDAAGAEVVLEKLLLALPDNVATLKLLGNIQVSQNDWTGLERTAQRLQTTHADNALGYHFMGLAQRGEKSFATSVEAFEQAVKRQPGAIGPWLEMAKSHLVLKQPHKALATLQRALEISPGNPVLLVLRGRIFLSQKRLAEAEASFATIIEGTPQWAEPYGYLAGIYLRRKDTEQAMRILEQGIATSKQTTYLRFQLAGLYLQRQNYADAIAHYEAILEDDPRSILTANNMAVAILRSHPDQAALDRALRLALEFEETVNPAFLDTLGWVHYHRGEYDEAISILERATNLPSKLPEHEYHLGMAYLKQGMREQARKHLQLALDSGAEFHGMDAAARALKSAAL